MPSVAGFNGRVTLSNPATGGNAVLMPSSRWQLTWKTDTLEVTTFEHVPTGTVNTTSTPLSDWIAGITDVDVSIDCYWDTTRSIYTTAPTMRPGDSIRAELMLDDPAASAFSFNVLLAEVMTDTEVRGVVRYSMTGKAQGHSLGSTGFGSNSPNITTLPS